MSEWSVCIKPKKNYDAFYKKSACLTSKFFDDFNRNKFSAVSEICLLCDSHHYEIVDKDVAKACIDYEGNQKIGGRIIKYLSDDLKNDKDLMKFAASLKGLYFEDMGDKCKSDKDVAMTAIQNYGKAYEFTSESLKKDKYLTMAAVKLWPSMLEFASDDLKNDKEVVMTAINTNGRAFILASDDLRDDKELAMIAINNISKHNDKVCASGDGHLQSGILEYVSERLRNDRDIILADVKTCGSDLLYAGKEFLHDREIVMTAVKENSEAFEALHENSIHEFDDDDDMIRAVIENRNTSYGLHYASDRLREDKDMIMLSFKHEFKQGGDGSETLSAAYGCRYDDDDHFKSIHNGCSDIYDKDIAMLLASNSSDSAELCSRVLSKDLCNDKELAMELVKYKKALSRVSDTLRNDKDVVMKSVEYNGDSLQYASDELRKDKDVVFKAVENNGDSLDYASSELYKDKNFMTDVVKCNGRLLEKASEELRKDKDVVKAAVCCSRICGHLALGYADRSLVKDVKFLASLYNDKYNNNQGKESVSKYLERCNDSDVPKISKVRQMSKVLKAADNAKDDKNVAKDGPNIK